jgi:isopenicillin-N epimerase
MPKHVAGSGTWQPQMAAEVGDVFLGRVSKLFSGDTPPLDMGAGPMTAALRAIEDCAGVCSTFADVRRAVAPGFGCDADEFIVTQSTTDSLCKILAGLELTAGDEILTSNHEHYGSRAPLALARDRHGVVIREVALPVGNNQRAEDYVELFERAVSDRTRILLFSSPTYTTGTLLPVRMLARMAQRRQLVTVVDAAHMPGMLHEDFSGLGVDFLAGSGTKWQYGPAGTGILYVRNKIRPEHNPRPLVPFWPVVSVWYPTEGGLPPRSATREASYDIAEYLQTIGNASRRRMAAFEQACATWDALGRSRIEAHLLSLGAYVKERIAEEWGEHALYSPRSDVRLSTAITSFTPFRNPNDVFDQEKASRFIGRLKDDFAITLQCTSFSVIGASRPHVAIRISPRVFHRHEDIEAVMRTMVQVARESS